MNTRRLVLHLIVGLLTFLIGVTIAVALGGFNPLAGLTRHGNRYQYAIPPQSLSVFDGETEYRGRCRNSARVRTAELRSYDFDSLTPPAPPVAPVAPVAPFDEDDAPPPPPKAPRPRH